MPVRAGSGEFRCHALSHFPDPRPCDSVDKGLAFLLITFLLTAPIHAVAGLTVWLYGARFRPSRFYHSCRAAARLAIQRQPLIYRRDSRRLRDHSRVWRGGAGRPTWPRASGSTPFRCSCTAGSGIAGIVCGASVILLLMRTRFALITFCAFFRTLRFAADVNGADLFEKKIRPVLAEHCYGCHSGKTPFSGLRLDSRASYARRGRFGKAARRPSGAMAKSRCRPPSPLSADQIADFEAWIKAGAARSARRKSRACVRFQRSPQVLVVSAGEGSRRRRRSPIAAWNKTAIDRFVKAKLDEKKLTPLGTARNARLIRRATFDLTGLPPTPEDVAAFLADTSAERVR